MSKQLIYSASFVFVLVFILTGAGNSADINLIGWWKLDETSGNIARDASGNGHDGTLKGDPEWITGMIDGALQVGGISTAGMIAVILGIIICLIIGFTMREKS